MNLTNWSLVTLLILFILHISRADTLEGHNRRGDRTCRKTPMLNYLGDYINVWKKVKLCRRVADVKSIIDQYGRLYISHRVPLDKAEVLCKFDCNY